MKLNVKVLAAAGAFLWGAAILFVSLANIARPDYGREFLTIATSVYQFYHAFGFV